MFISKILMVVENSNFIQVRQQCLRCNYTNIELKIPIFFRYVLNFKLKIIQIFGQFFYRNDRERLGHLLECVELFGKLINKSEI